MSWPLCRIGDVGEVQLGRQRSPEHHSGPNMRPYLRVANVFDNFIDTSDVMSMNFSPAEFERFRLRRGDILLNEGQSRHLVGRPAMFRGEVPDACFTNSLVRFRAGPRLVPEFALYVFRHYVYSGEFMKIAKWTTNIAHLGAERFASLSMPVPTLDVQRRIVAKLDELLAQSRAAREQLEAVPSLVEQYRQSVLVAAFRGDLTKEWRAKNPEVEPASKLLERIRAERRRQWEAAELAKMNAKGKAPKDDKWKAKHEEPEPVDASELPELPPTWAWARWSEVAWSQNGRPFPSSDYSDRGVRLLRPGNLHVSGEVRWTPENTKCMPESYVKENEGWVVGSHQLVMNLTAQSLKDEFLGRVCITGEGERCLLNQRIAWLKPVLIDPRFALWLLKSPMFRRFVDGLNTGTLIQHMFTSQLDDWSFPLPPLEEQAQLVRTVDGHASAWRRVAEASRETVESLPALERSLLAKAFRGELDVEAGHQIRSSAQAGRRGAA